MPRNPSGRAGVFAPAAAVLLCSPALAQDRSAPPADEILVTGKFTALHLDEPSEVGSRLGLSLRETPAAVEVLTQDQLQVRGLRTAREAFADITGAIAGNVPGNPATVTLRGFSGSAVTVLFDGVRAGASTLVTRDSDMWNYERVEAIKGPASVLDGEGALAGAINLVTKQPALDRASANLLASVGSFDTTRLAGDLNLPLSRTVAVLASGSRLRSASLSDIDDNRFRSDIATASLLWRPDDRLRALLAVDYAADRSAATYQGSPLIPAALARDPSDVVTSADGLVVDRATRHINYNPIGGYQDGRSVTVRGRTDADLGDGWTLGSNLLWLHARRHYLYSNDQTFQPSTGLLTRSLRDIANRQDFTDGRLTLARDAPLFGLRDRLVIGIEGNDTRFLDPRRFGRLAPVTIVDPVRGAVPVGAAAVSPGAGNDLLFRSRLRQAALFAENALDVAPRLLLVGGIRWERIALDRTAVDYGIGTTTRANPRFHPLTGRAGVVYSLAPTIQLYAQYATAVVPVGTLLILTTASARYDLSTGDTVEVGGKASFAGGRLSLTGAAYRIRLRHILTVDPVTSLSVQGGSQSARGVEGTLGAELGHGLHLDAGAAYTDARFDRLVEAGGADRAGRRPPNTPAATANGALMWRVPGTPLTLAGFAQHVGHFFTDNANSRDVHGRTTLDASIALAVPHGTVTLRGRNLNNALYGEYSGYPATQIYLGAPRGVELAYAAHF